jgi:hypothetical protein
MDYTCLNPFAFGLAGRLRDGSIRAFFRECLKLVHAWTVFEELRIVEKQTLPTPGSR